MSRKFLVGRVSLLLMVAMASSATAEEKGKNLLHSFKRLQLSDKFYCEGAHFGDFNHDGKMDIVSGPCWYAGPAFTERHEYYAPQAYDIAVYSENFLTFTHDVNKDGWDDIIVIGFPGKEALWYENPQGKSGNWPRHVAIDVCDNESPTVVDITGDGVPELVCDSGGRAVYAEIPKDDPTKPWTVHAITDKRGYERFTHGMGVGDVNGDGQMDLLQKEGWFEQPAAGGKERPWKFHAFNFSDPGGSQMFAFDVDGDGDNDVVSSKAAHAYGLAWFENQGADGQGGVKFQEHKFMGEKPDENEFGVAFSQLHAVAIADMDHDGVPDIITGKRFWAHAEHDPGSLDPAVLYWFKTARDGKEVHFIPYLIDKNSGVGTQVTVGDINGDKWDDVVVGNKKGTFVFTHEVEPVERAKWEAAQPKAVKKGEPAASVPPAVDAKKAASAAVNKEEGFAATSADGRVLNLDFEKGDLSDWTTTGDAFENQPTEADTMHARRKEASSGHQGRFWVGSGEGRRGESAQGTLTSAPFKVTHPYATFMVAGGAGGALRAELVRVDNQKVVFSASGRNQAELRTVVADLHKVLGEEIFIRLIDTGSAGWAFISFDNFRFFDAPPQMKAPAGAGADDLYPYAGLSGEEAAKVMKLPEGFSVTLAAAEPDVKQPIAMALDDRGRLWVAEAYEYPVRAPEGQGRDRILVFEDTDGDGKFDRRRVFAEKLNLVSGLEVGFGGVFVGAAPYLLFIPDKNGDDVPDGKPEVLLDGWAYHDTHETLNAFIWGPDGWLYGCHGVFTHSLVGKPGAPESERTPLNAAIWRYQPVTKKFEVFAEGTSNPWGVDFDDHGQAFCTACVIPHLYHIIQGGRYQRQAGNHFERYTYADIQTIADHRHYLGDNPHGGNGRSDDAGGGHAHAGAMIYLGGAWPDQYRHSIFMNNIHGQRINQDLLEQQGSGFVGHHGQDFLLTGDLASQMLNLRYGPDGEVYIIDWYDMNACHHTNAEGHDRTNGRIYTVTYGERKHNAVDLKKLSDAELADLVLEKNDWYVRHARRLLQERAAAGKLDLAARKRLGEIAAKNPNETRRLRALWALHAAGGVPGDLMQRALADKNEYVRAWAVQVSLDSPQPNLAELLPQFATLAEQDPSPVVRLYVASAMQRVPEKERWEVLEKLVAHAGDANDHNLPFMYWYAAEPLAAVDADRALLLGLACGKTIPQLREFMLRRIGSLEENRGVAVLLDGLRKSKSSDEQLTILRSLRSALVGRRQATAPKAWEDIYAELAKSDKAELKSEADALGVVFGDRAAMGSLRAIAGSATADEAARRDALKALLAVKDPKLAATLLELLGDAKLRDAAIVGLAAYDAPETPAKILGMYEQMTASEKRAALATLAARSSYATELLQAVAGKRVPAKDLSSDVIRQLHNLKDESINKMIVDVWGQVRSTPADKLEMIAKFRDLIKQHADEPQDLSLGRAVFGKTCQQCHTLYGVGANIGPDLTGSNRADAEYLLSNVVDPSAVMAKEYQPSVITTTDGRVITGIVSKEDDKSVTIRNATETIVLPKNEIGARELSQTSMMPEDQLKQFSTTETLALFAYLRGKEQVPMLATTDNAASFFNGKDLTGWTGDSGLWSVENGEIVGRSNGLSHNTFLLSDLLGRDFKLAFDVKLVDDRGNSGVQFRTESIDGCKEVRGYQADIGPGWWGKLYEENGRGLLAAEGSEKFLKRGDWNHYEMEAIGTHVRTWLNGQPCVDLEDPAGKRQGLFALQLHAGEPTEVRFRNLELEVK